MDLTSLIKNIINIALKTLLFIKSQSTMSLYKLYFLVPLLIFSACNNIEENEGKIAIELEHEIIDSTIQSSETIQLDSIVKNEIIIKQFVLNTSPTNLAEKYLAELKINENSSIIKDAFKVKNKLNDDLLLSLELNKIHKTPGNSFKNVNSMILSTAEISSNYLSYIIGFEDPCCWYEFYIANYTLDGNLIDFLLIEQDDYIESFTPLHSKIFDNKIARTLQKANIESDSMYYENWKTDEFTIDQNGMFVGENIIKRGFSNSSIKFSFLGTWTKADNNNPIGSDKIVIKEAEDGYYIDFGDGDMFYKIESNNAIEGENFSGKFSIISNKDFPNTIYYSDDGRGHFNPIINEQYVKKH